ERYTPYVIEPSFGLTRSMMAFLVDAYTEDEAPNTKGGVDTRTVLKLDPRLAPVKVAVLPLSKSEDLVPRSQALAKELRGLWNVEVDVSQAIGRRYRRQDEIGTPFCVTVDFDTAEDQAVTIRDRDTMGQERVALDQVRSYLAGRLVGA
ncbi:MAG: His/Gly/Thr/Pro-type tRNA ligase C-terminal domain-containing protein, partial [Brachybacterium sp.]|nr:His/Gly/Thr/Pro-type tRNA ligase C-terminal domain-containing protein [Brachybacterium sp.]